MQLVLWIGLCLAASFLLRRHIRVMFAAVLCLWVLVPTVGSPLITGVGTGPLSLHAATWLVLSMAAARMLHDPWSVQEVLARRFFLFLAIALAVIAAFLASALARDGGGMVLLVDQVVVPVLFFLLLLADAARGEGLVAMLRTVLLALAALSCLLAIGQFLMQSVLFYESGFRTQYWFEEQRQERWMATLDQPLALSLFICLAVPLLAGLKRRWLQLLLLALMAVGMLITQSRVGLVALAVTVLATVLFAKWRTRVKAAILLLMAGGAGALVVSPLVAGVAARVTDDTGSAEARGLALDYFLARWHDYALSGEGMGASYRLAVQAGLKTSFENPLVMYSIDIGLVFTLLYFGSMAAPVAGAALTARPGAEYPGLLLAGLMAVVIPQTYSSLATRSAAGVLVWTVLAMVAIAAAEARQQHAETPWDGGGRAQGRGGARFRKESAEAPAGNVG